MTIGCVDIYLQGGFFQLLGIPGEKAQGCGGGQAYMIRGYFTPSMGSLLGEGWQRRPQTSDPKTDLLKKPNGVDLCVPFAVSESLLIPVTQGREHLLPVVPKPCIPRFYP